MSFTCASLEQAAQQKARPGNNVHQLRQGHLQVLAHFTVGGTARWWFVSLRETRECAFVSQERKQKLPQVDFFLSLRRLWLSTSSWPLVRRRVKKKSKKNSKIVNKKNLRLFVFCFVFSFVQNGKL
jgi:hypothetical protein